MEEKTRPQTFQLQLDTNSSSPFLVYQLLLIFSTCGSSLSFIPLHRLSSAIPYLPHSPHSFHSLLPSSPLRLCISSVSLTTSFPFSTIPPTSPFLRILHPPSSTYPCVTPLPPTLNQSVNQPNALYLSPCGSANTAVALYHCEPTRTRCC